MGFSGFFLVLETKRLDIDTLRVLKHFSRKINKCLYLSCHVIPKRKSTAFSKENLIFMESFCEFSGFFKVLKLKRLDIGELIFFKHFFRKTQKCLKFVVTKISFLWKTSGSFEDFFEVLKAKRLDFGKLNLFEHLLQKIKKYFKSSCHVTGKRKSEVLSEEKKIVWEFSGFFVVLKTKRL